jgi:hypothetical protein
VKDISEVVVCVVDYGRFLFLAECFVGVAKKVLFCSPSDREFKDVRDCEKGTGIPGIERIDSFLDPHVLPRIDLFVFPDIGFAGAQLYLRSIGKAVWGAMGVNDLELSRTDFLDFLDQVGLEKIPSVKVKGLTNLCLHLQEHKDKWIKVNHYRAQMETWHHIDFDRSEEKLVGLSAEFGGLKEEIMFVVQDALDADEIGYDGWSVDGGYPSCSFQGYELKNELYLGSMLEYEDLPEQVIEVNEAMAPLFSEAGYRQFVATEIRVKDKVGRFIDPTFRLAGLTQEQLSTTCSNLPDVIWSGANGVLIEPEFICKYVAVATMHYTDHAKERWFCLKVPEEKREFFKFYHYCQRDGMLHFIPCFPFDNEAGVVIGGGDSVGEAIDNLKENFEVMADEPLRIDVAGFAELLEQIQEAEDEGMEFSDQEIPEPETVL